jgi:hypothetical protein
MFPGLWNTRTSLGAQRLHYTIFSIAPLLIIIIAIAGLVFGHDAAQGAIAGQLSGLMGKQSAEILQSMIQSASHQGTGIFATIIGIGTFADGDRRSRRDPIRTQRNLESHTIGRAFPAGSRPPRQPRLGDDARFPNAGFVGGECRPHCFGSYLSYLLPGANFLMSLLNWLFH